MTDRPVQTSIFCLSCQKNAKLLFAAVFIDPDKEILLA